MANSAFSRLGRRHLLVLGLFIGTIAAVLVGSHVLAIEQPTLRERLEKGLRARTTADFAFLDRVIDDVEDGDLPQILVDRVFFWARKKADLQIDSKRRRPMVYFQPALTILARRIGVDLS